LQVQFCGSTKNSKFGCNVAVNAKDVVGKIKVEVCEEWDLDPRLTTVYRDPREDRSNRTYCWRIDPRLSFEENEILEGDRLFLGTNQEIGKVCPVCLTLNEPSDRPAMFGAACFRYICADCGWHWEVVQNEFDGFFAIHDEIVHVSIDAPPLKSSYTQIFPSSASARTILNYLHKKYGVRKAANEGVSFPVDFVLHHKNEPLDPEKTLAEQGIHYETSLTLQRA